MAIKSIRNLPIGHGDGSWIMRVAGVSEPVVCTCSFNFTTPPNGAAMLDIQDAFGDTIMTKVTAGFTLENFHVFFKVDASNDQVFDANGPPVVGTGGTAAAAGTPQLAVLVRKKTQFAGRRNSGRMYIPGPSEATFDSLGVMGAADITAWTTILGQFGSRLSQYNPEIVHSKQYDDATEPVPPLPPAPTPVTSWAVDNVCATQRRRLHR